MAKTDCREVIEAFEAILNDPAAHGPEIGEMLAHVGTCPACRERASQLARLLAAGTADEDVLTCGECEELLPGYLAAESLGGAAEVEWSRVVRHLAACPHCAAAHASLAHLFSLAQGESGAAPSSYPRPDLSFLRDREPSARGAAAMQEPAGSLPAATPGKIFLSIPEADLWQQAVQGLHRLAAVIPVLIGRAGASFGALAAPLTVQLTPVPVYRGKGSLVPAEEARDFRELVELPHPETNVTLKVSIGPVFQGQGSLALAVNKIDPPQPIAQARITLRDADGALLEGASTGDDGVVLFRDLDIGEYLIRVEHGERAWEFPLTFVSA